MRRRGPDAQAAEHLLIPDGRHVYLLAARLSIIDLDRRSNQPFCVGTKHMAYNGELYNYVEVADELRLRGRALRTSSDTEVLLAALDELGWSALERLEGMWALAVYDAADGSVTLARDRFGEKPLYFHVDASGLTFGSEPKFVAALLGRSLDVDVTHLRRYLADGYRALYKGGATFFHGLEELPAATILRVGGDGGRADSSYWSPRFAPDDSMTYADAVDGVREHG